MLNLVIVTPQTIPGSLIECQTRSSSPYGWGGGGGGIRTHATLSRPIGFQDRSLRPLEYTSVDGLSGTRTLDPQIMSLLR